MKTAKVWYKYRHDDFGTKELPISGDLETLIDFLHNDLHGMYTENGFVPWHQIESIEEIDA